MKFKRVFILFIVFSFLLLNGCADFLKEDLQGLVDIEKLDENKVESLIIGMYEPLTRSRGRLWESHWGRTLILLEEHAVSRLKNKNDVANYRFGSDPYMMSSGWPTIYESISRANILLNLLGDDKNLDEAFKNKAIAEAGFIRAFDYFQLVRIYGKVPLRLEPLTDVNNSGQALAEKSEIYAQIISDLKIAEEYLSVTTKNPGRATKGTAKTMLADVYLTLNMLEEARTKVVEIMANKNLYGYDIITSLDMLYSPTSPTNDEDIFSLKFSRFVGQGSFLAAYSAPLSYPEVAAVRAFEDYGANTKAPILRDWDNNDLRKNLNIYNTAIVNGELVEIQMAGDYTHVYGKHRDPEQPEETASGVDYYMYRYADVLLIFAETENKLNGPTAAAYDAINTLRRRAYGVNMKIANAQADLPEGLSQQEFDDMVFRERGYEFMFEGKRWFDLKRTGRWQTIIPEAGKDIPTSLDWPFPPNEILYNDDVD